WIFHSRGTCQMVAAPEPLLQRPRFLASGRHAPADVARRPFLNEVWSSGSGLGATWRCPPFLELVSRGSHCADCRDHGCNSAFQPNGSCCSGSPACKDFEATLGRYRRMAWNAGFSVLFGYRQGAELRSSSGSGVSSLSFSFCLGGRI